MKSNKIKAADFDPAVNMVRQSLYRFAALSLLDPLSGSWQQLHELRDDPVLLDAAAFLRDLPDARPQTLGLGERSLDDLDPQLVLDRLPDSQQALNAEYECTFGLLVSSACPPYETEYVDSKFTFQHSNSLADIGGFIRRSGSRFRTGIPSGRITWYWSWSSWPICWAWNGKPPSKIRVVARHISKSAATRKLASSASISPGGRRCLPSC